MTTVKEQAEAQREQSSFKPLPVWIRPDGATLVKNTRTNAWQSMAEITVLLDVVLEPGVITDLDATYTFERRGVIFTGVKPELLSDGFVRFQATYTGQASGTKD